MAVLLCQSASLVQQDTSSHSFLSFFFLNALFSLLQARQSSTFFEPHSSNSASLPLLTHNIQRTSRTTVFFVFLFLQVLKNALHSFFPDLKFFFLSTVFYMCRTKRKEKEKDKGAEMRSCMVQVRSDEFVIRHEKLTSCVPHWIWWSKKKKNKKARKACVLNSVVSH